MKLFNKFYSVLFITMVVLLTCVDCLPAKTLQTDSKSFAIINTQKVFLAVADTEEKRTRGLMYIDSLKENQGMVFLFSGKDYRYFWMKNTEIPLDIVFINNNKITYIQHDLPICRQDKCPIYDSKSKADKVIELKGGFCKKYNIKIGDKVKFSKNI